MNRNTQLETAYHRHADLLYRLALAELQRPQDAEDAVADAFERYLTSAPPFQNEEGERAWLIRVTVNRSRDLYRRRRIRTHEPLEAAETIGVTDEAKEVLHALSELPHKYRTVITLHYLEGFSVAEIGAALNLSESAVKMRLSRGREQLKPKLKGEDERV
ncbi:MAG: RNA polymerase sigma factor [Clostridia bacterium]|nr:RNA polymerase sigma factor [Clostridia bacterium]